MLLDSCLVCGVIWWRLNKNIKTLAPAWSFYFAYIQKYIANNLEEGQEIREHWKQ